jgi:thiosulfate/3-mercaptopyruvate sulfurtransferase
MLRPVDSSAPAPISRWLVSTEWLAQHLRDPKVAVVGSHYVPTQKEGDGHAEYLAGHIPGAVYFDI